MKLPSMFHYDQALLIIGFIFILFLFLFFEGRKLCLLDCMIRLPFGEKATF
jgi:uncharacterized membrane protein YGL010W